MVCLPSPPLGKAVKSASGTETDVLDGSRIQARPPTARADRIQDHGPEQSGSGLTGIPAGTPQQPLPSAPSSFLRYVSANCRGLIPAWRQATSCQFWVALKVATYSCRDRRS